VTVPKYRALIVDDEPVARRGVRLLLEHDPAVDIVGEAGSGREALEQIRRLAPDLLFLDVQMPEMHGFEVLAQLPPDTLPVVVFVTAYDQYALAAFEAHAVEYVLKPYTDDRFAAAVARAKLELERREAWAFRARLVDLVSQYEGDRALAAASSAARRGGGAREDGAREDGAREGDHLRWLVVKASDRMRVVRTVDVDWVEAADNYVRVHAAGNAYLLHAAIAALESRLDPRRFVRIHRGTIVNLDRIRELQPYFRGEHVVMLHDGTRLKLSRHRRRALEEALGSRL
jgi:two-component system, LytTR family, response regulator